MDNKKILDTVYSLNRKILRRVEIELEILSEQGINTEPIMKRLRKGILDDIGTCKRAIEKDLSDAEYSN